MKINVPKYAQACDASGLKKGELCDHCGWSGEMHSAYKRDANAFAAGRRSGKNGLTFRAFCRVVLGEQGELPPHIERMAELLEEGTTSVAVSTSPRHGRTQAFRMMKTYLAEHGTDAELIRMKIENAKANFEAGVYGPFAIKTKSGYFHVSREDETEVLEDAVKITRTFRINFNDIEDVI